MTANSIGFPSGSSPAGSVPHVWSKYLAKTYDAASVFVPLVNRDVQGDLASEGDTVHVQKYGTVSVTDYVLGTDNSTQTVSLTDNSLVLDQKKYFQFVIDDIEKATSQLDLVKGFTGRGMITMAQTMDDRIITHTADALAANKIGSTTAPVTLTQDNIYAYFVLAKQNLDQANIPAEDRVMVIDPPTASLLVRSPDLIRNTPKGDSIVEKATIGDVANFRVVVSNRYVASSGAMTMMYFHKDFISLAVRISPDKVELYRTEKQFGQGVKCLAFYGSKVFNANAGGTIVKAA